MKPGSQTDTCMRVFITALFTVARRWKQLKSPLIHEWINKMWSSYTMDFYSALKREGNSETCYDMDESLRHYTSEISQTQKRNTRYDST